jgi:hypothetical protein
MAFEAFLKNSHNPNLNAVDVDVSIIVRWLHHDPHEPAIATQGCLRDRRSELCDSALAGCRGSPSDRSTARHAAIRPTRLGIALFIFAYKSVKQATRLSEVSVMVNAFRKTSPFLRKLLI